MTGEYGFLKSVGATDWPYIFNEWRKGEECQESWQLHWKERGYDSWTDWRSHYIAPLHPEKLKWSLYEIEKPTEALLDFYGVPTKAWRKKAYNGETTKQLRDIGGLPIIAENEKIKEIMKDFPGETLLTALSHDGKIILIEGMHRANALANWNLPDMPNGKVLLAMAEWDEEDLPILGSGYKE